MKRFFYLFTLISVADAFENETERIPLFDTFQSDPNFDYRYHFDGKSRFKEEAWHPETVVSEDEDLTYFRTCLDGRANLEDGERENWMLIPKIPVEAATDLEIEVEFTVEKCENQKGQEKKCRRDVILQAYPLPKSQRLPGRDWHKQDGWEEVGALNLTNPASKGDKTVHVQQFAYSPSDSAVYFGLKDHGACLTLHYLKVYSIETTMTIVEEEEEFIISAASKSFNSIAFVVLLLLFLKI